MKFYVSGKIGDDGRVKIAMKALEEAGHQITFDWTTTPHLKPYDKNVEACQEAAVGEVKGVTDADVFILIPNHRGIGMYIELGIALGFGIPIRVITRAESQSMFFHHPLVKRVYNIGQVVEEFGQTIMSNT